MEDHLDTLLFGRDLSPEVRSSIQEQFDDDPELASAWAHWCAARRRLRDRLEEQVSDRRLLVLYVLEQEEDAGAITAREQNALDECRDDIAQALDAIPALGRVVERIRDEQADFEDTWATYVDEDSELASAEAPATNEAAQPASSTRPDRAPRAPASQEGSGRRWSRRLAVAALVVGLAIVGVLLWPQGSSMTTVTVADGRVQVEEIGEGATVRLVGPATFSYPSEEAPVRRVRLTEGRAYFDVQPRSDASFVVETPTATATVLGTQFGVTTRPDTTEVVLASGSVRVEDGDAETDEGVVLEPGQRSWVTAGQAPAVPEAVDLTGALEWTGLFVFRSLPLDTIADRLAQRYDVQITVAESLADEPVTGTFERDQPVEEVLGALAATLGAEVKTEGDEQYRLVLQ